MTPFTLDLTDMPPSVNSIWRTGRRSNGKPHTYLDAGYRSWKLSADADYMMSGKKVTFTVPVKVTITLNEKKKRGDADNRQKTVNDWLQRVEIVSNDKLIEDCRVLWGACPKGVRIVVEAIA